MIPTREEDNRNGSIPMSCSLEIDSMALLVCSVLNTKWPVSEARIAI